MGSKKTKIPPRALEMALASMAERAVHAEARAEAAEAENKVLKRENKQLSEYKVAGDRNHWTWWVVLWTKLGVSGPVLVKYLMEAAQMSQDEAKKYVYPRYAGYYTSPDNAMAPSFSFGPISEP